MSKLHVRRTLPYESPMVWTLCGRYLPDLGGIAAFEDGVTCKACRKAIDWNRERAEEWKARQNRLKCE